MQKATSAKSHFDHFIKKLLAKAATISMMGLVRDTGATVRLYDQFDLDSQEFDQRLTTALAMSTLFIQGKAEDKGIPHILRADKVVISIHPLRQGWHLVVMGNDHSIPGPFPEICAEYLQAASQTGKKRLLRRKPQISRPVTVASEQNEPRIIGDPADFIVNPFTQNDKSQADVYLVLEPEEEHETPATLPSTSPHLAEEKSNIIIGDPDLFFANPFGRQSSQAVMASGQLKHHQ